ncbi:MAG: polyribonucleotide nucleotidyltransferase [Thermotogaceae bacterium]|nr:polyribonucleotide nucleotidyltransferase [Thermotogaceae bacterium]MDN5337494.1 polyribonucleotide nucleotidyltransferase [Thermotogaceae bacterium]
MYKVWKKNFFGRELIIEHGKMAKQANGSVVLRFADSALLVTATASDEPSGNLDFMPLTVEYQEKFYAAGKIPGGFIKRESRPGETAILSARLIDRPIRPLFPKKFTNEVQIVVTVLSVDPDNPPDTWGIFGTSVALNLSNIPFEGVVAGVRVGYIDGEYVVFPKEKDMERSLIDIVVAGTKEAVTMVEGEAKEVSEEEMLNALEVAHNAIKELVEFQEEIIKEFSIEKMEIKFPELPEDIKNKFQSLIDFQELEKRLLTKGKHARSVAIKEYRDVLLEQLKTEVEINDENVEKLLKIFYEEEVKKTVRKMIVEKNLRVDGRSPTDIRPITCEVGLFPRTHGSALFTRGETQSLGIVTLGAPMDEQIIDSLLEEGTKRFMLHYNFPPYSTGEVKPLRGPSRREIGHGHLAERALKNLLPSEEEFPYTIRVVSEILESNGSSSMATVCSGSLALMDAGVPIHKHVAGVAMGLIKEDDKVVILTDILGTEDHYGDMDFKVAGTREGITAFQMDVKISGIDRQIMARALEQAKEARNKILNLMYETIAEPRSAISKYAPVIVVTQIDPMRVGELIGPGGKVIKKLTKDYDVNIIIDDEEGKVKIIGNNPENIKRVKEIAEKITRDIEVGQRFIGTVTRVESYGAFVEVLPGKLGLVHISKMGERVRDINSVLKIGDNIEVEVINIDELGRLQLKRIVNSSNEKKAQEGKHFGYERKKKHEN